MNSTQTYAVDLRSKYTGEYTPTILSVEVASVDLRSAVSEAINSANEARVDGRTNWGCYEARRVN